MTGAVMPAGLDTVVPQEFVTLDGDPSACPRAWSARRQPPLRRRGPGARRDRARRRPRAGPADLGLLASLGLAEVPVWRRLRVAFFSTGDELRSIGEPLDAGLRLRQQPLHAVRMLQRLGVEVLDLGVVRDEPDALEGGVSRRRRLPMR